jgi:hypothetical protein
MRHHHHPPRPHRPRRTRSPRERCEPPSIVTSSQPPPPSPSSCSQPVAVVTTIAVDSEWAVSSPRSCYRWGQGAATLLEQPVLASCAPILLPARVEALPVRCGECRSRPRTPCRGTGPWRQHRRRGCRDASVSLPAADARPSFASQAAAAGRATATAALRRGLELCLCCGVILP